jgi:aspartyl-tRNA(Asn)/glutamyl-tRNA(Gln) amidotransferase subunit B
MLGLLAKGTISGKMAKDFFEEMYTTGADPADILKKKGGQITDPAEVEKIIRQVLAANPGAVAEYRSGKEGPFNFLIGQAMKATRGKANPQLVNELLKKALQGP